MPKHSAITLLGILQRHGLSVEVLELWVHHCEARQTGELVLLTTEGHITSYKASYCGKVRALETKDLDKNVRCVTEYA